MQKVTLQVLKKLGGFLTSDEVCKSTSHVIAGSPRRTLNILMGIAQGCWIVCYDWVSNTMTVNRLSFSLKIGSLSGDNGK